jgi:hypothetical protein
MGVKLGLTLGSQHGLRVSEKRKWREAGEDCIMRSFIG